MNAISKYIILFFLLFGINELIAQKIYINQVFYDSPLDENKYKYDLKEHHNGEFIELYNPSPNAVDISGYSLKGMEAYEVYKFPLGTTFPPKTYLIVAYKHALNKFRLKHLFPDISDLENQGLVYYQNNIILNNKGEEIFLMDRDRVVIDRMSYNGTSDGVLFAHNGAGRPSHLCLALHRHAVSRDGDGNGIFKESDWTHGPVKPLETKIHPFFADDEGSINSIDGQNYIHIRSMLNSGGTEYIDNIRYLDGLGRPKQTVQRKTGPNWEDIVDFQEYDELGRKSNTWLPGAVSNNNGAFVSDPRQKIKDSYDGDKNPYTKTVYEVSPSNRIIEQYGPGQDWHTGKKSIAISYLTNDKSDSLICKYYFVSGNNLVKNNNYVESQLYITRTSDEDGNATFEFKDKLGQTILTRQRNNKINHDTYYVYDVFGDLRYVLPPLASDELTTDHLDYNTSTPAIDRYGYYYLYDQRRRCVTKKLPGCEPTHYMYDYADQLIFSQDGEQRKKNEWFFSIPDVLGRIAITGICKSPIVYHNEVAKAIYAPHHSGFLSSFYSIDGIDFEGTTKILTVSYYDNYHYLSRLGTTLQNQLSYNEQADYGKQYINTTDPEFSSIGLLTGTRTELLDNSGSSLYTAMYYDNKGRTIQQKSATHLGGFEYEYVKYNFTNQPEKCYKKHISEHHRFNICNHENDILDETFSYEYDHAGRLKKTFHNGKLVEELAYNKLGQVHQKKQSNILDTEYTYNIRGWTKEIKEKNTGFEQILFYQDNPYNKLYNGNISSIEYGYSIDATRKFNYRYDQLNRLLYSSESRGPLSITEESFEYDKHGNQKIIFRMFNSRVTDAISLSHRGNQLSNLSNEYPDMNGVDYTEYPTESASFSYNSNGALISDSGREIVAIRYNLLNLPDTIQFKNGNAIYYSYSATGQKLRTKHIIAKTGIVVPMGQTRSLNPSLILSTLQTDYTSNLVLENGMLKRQAIPGGYLSFTPFTDNNGQYHCAAYNFYNKDYQGNNRDVVSESGTIIQRTEYGAFGTPFPQNTGDAGAQPHKYSDKEFDRMHGLNWYDFEARMQDPILDQFHTMDPMAENYYSISPYAYCANNPVNFIDPNGTDVVYVFEDGTEYDRIEAEGEDVVVVGISIEPVVTLKSVWYYEFYNKYYDDGIPTDHEMLSYSSYVPGYVGILANIANAGLYAYEGEYSNATWNAAALLPVGKIMKGGNLLGAAAKGGTKAIAQFSGRTIDDAVGIVMKDANKLNHLFPAKHNLGGLVNQLGGQENTIRAVLNAANGKLPASGVFNNIPVSVGGQTVFIRGSVIDGIPRLGTMFIP